MESFEEFWNKNARALTGHQANLAVFGKGLGEWAWNALLEKCCGIEGIKKDEEVAGLFDIDIFDEDASMEHLLAEIAIGCLGRKEIQKRLEKIK